MKKQFLAKEGGDIGLFIALAPKVLFWGLLLNLIGWFIILSVQTF